MILAAIDAALAAAPEAEAVVYFPAGVYLTQVIGQASSGKHNPPIIGS